MISKLFEKQDLGKTNIESNIILNVGKNSKTSFITALFTKLRYANFESI